MYRRDRLSSMGSVARVLYKPVNRHQEGMNMPERKRLALLVMIVAMFSAVAAEAKILVVKKSGESFWIASATRDGDNFVYMNDSGEETAVPVSELDGIVPKAVRGRHYNPVEVDKFIKRIGKLKAKHPKLIAPTLLSR